MKIPLPFLVIILLAAMVVIGHFIIPKDFFKIDTCLDRGGRWNYDARSCEYRETIKTP